jgi:opacity protein-like surface antigen
MEQEMNPPGLSSRFAFSALLLLGMSTDRAQGDSTGVVPPFPTDIHAQAIQVHFVGGYTASYKYHLSPQYAFRITADVSGLVSKNIDDVTSPSGSTETIERRSNKQQFTLNPHYLYYTSAAGRLKPFFGAGVFGELSREYQAVEVTDDRTTDTYNRTWTQWYVGVSAHAGVDCHITDFLSLLAEYELDFGYRPELVEDNLGYVTKGKGWLLQLSSLRIGLGVYL